MASRRCLICADINPCAKHTEALQAAELARNDVAIAHVQHREPDWKRINALFARYGLPPPPIGLRDILVTHLIMHDRHGGYRP